MSYSELVRLVPERMGNMTTALLPWAMEHRMPRLLLPDRAPNTASTMVAPGSLTGLSLPIERIVISALNM